MNSTDSIKWKEVALEIRAVGIQKIVDAIEKLVFENDDGLNLFDYPSMIIQEFLKNKTLEAIYG